jgi:nucleotide-binding universal stress UspA family protein
VVGRHGFGADGRFLLGSLTDQVVRRSDRSVLAIPPEPS